VTERDKDDLISAPDAPVPGTVLGDRRAESGQQARPPAAEVQLQAAAQPAVSAAKKVPQQGEAAEWNRRQDPPPRSAAKIRRQDPPPDGARHGFRAPPNLRAYNRRLRPSWVAGGIPREVRAC